MMHLSLFFSILLGVSASNVSLQPRLDACDALTEDYMGDDDLVASTSVGTAGIGAEFECPLFYLENSDCSKEDTDPSKRKVIGGRSGTNFALTADTTGGAGILNAEYILDGQNIKVGSGDAATAGAAAAADIMAWQPWNGDDINNIDVADSNCNPWTVAQPRKGYKPEDLQWDVQVTAPMPLEAIYFLMRDQLQDKNPPERNMLTGLPSNRFGNSAGNLFLVTNRYFQTNTLGISDVSDDVLAFCSLVMSYAKGAKYQLKKDQSPKLLMTFMPRTEFITMFQQVKSKLPTGDDLFTLFDSLACYKTKYVSNTIRVSLDTDYCSGTMANPVSNNKFSDLTYTNPDTQQSVNIKAWIQGIGSGTTGTQDLLSQFDQSIDGSIGGLKTTMEKMYNSQRSVPLFEFRDMYTTYGSTPRTDEFKAFMGDIDTTVQNLHTTYATAPTRRKRQVGVLPASCSWNATTNGTITSSVPVSITPAPTPSCTLYNEDPDQGIDQAYCLCDSSITLTPLSVPQTGYQSQSCEYTAIPTATSARETITIPTEVWTSNCAACTIVGGIADSPTCTTVAGCTPTPTVPSIAAWVGNLSTIDIGDADDGSAGQNLASDMFGKLKAQCSGSTCTSDHVEMDNVETIIQDGEEPLKPAMFIQDAAFTSQDILEQMLAVGIASWVSAINNPTLNLCKNVTYEAEDDAESGCGTGPIPTRRLRRKIRSDNGAVLWEREGLAEEERELAERCSDFCDQPRTCTYSAVMCSAPDEITVVRSGAGNKDPYENYLNIGVTLDGSDGDGFECEEITDALTAAVAILAPELLEEDALADIDLQALCDFVDDPQAAVSSLASRQLFPRIPKSVPATPTEIAKIDKRVV